MPIDGKTINADIGQKLLYKIKENNLKPVLGILCIGSDPASLQFINVKKRFGEKYGFVVRILNLNEEESLENIITKFDTLQKESDGVIVQLPLPQKCKDMTKDILSHIEKSKDVDNLNGGIFMAPIVSALEKVLKLTIPNLEENKSEIKFGIVGLGQVVGLPIKNYLDSKNYNLEIITKENFERISTCDVIISGVGKPLLIKPDDIKMGSILIDYGCSFMEDPWGSSIACGDFDPACFGKAKFYTPVPGCMGPLVVAALFENVIKATKYSMI